MSVYLSVIIMYGCLEVAHGYLLGSINAWLEVSSALHEDGGRGTWWLGTPSQFRSDGYAGQ